MEAVVPGGMVRMDPASLAADRAEGSAQGQGRGGLDPGPLSYEFFFFFCFFNLIYRGGHFNRLGKYLIYRDLPSEAVVITASKNQFCLPRLIFSVVVLPYSPLPSPFGHLD
jgi:hypothetical protein